MTHSNATKSKVKPAKPYRDFPLFPHAAGVWAKKIRGKLHYFGKWADPQAALRRYLDEKDALYAGRTPSPGPEGVTIRELLNRFLTAKAQLLDSGELTPRTFADYKSGCDRVKDEFGLDRRVATLGAEDFEHFRAKLAKRWGPVTLGNCIQRIRVLFKFGFDSGLIDKPVRFGPMFRMPSRRVLRKARHANGSKMFEADELRCIIDAAGQPLKAMILLGINCGYGNHDVAGLPLAALDLDAGWARFARPKTAIDRRCPLWSQTVEAIRGALAARPKPKEAKAGDLVFVTRCGASWGKESMDNPVAKEFAKLVKALGLKRKGRGFYALRHTFETIAGDSRDQVAVTEHVRKWLFGEPKAK